MGKVRQFMPRDKFTPREHPEGGTFFIRATDSDEVLKYQEQLEAVNDAAKKGSSATAQQRAQFNAFLDFACGLVDRVEDIIDVTTGEPIESTPELIRALLAEIAQIESPEIGANGEATTRDEITAIWVFGESAELGKIRREKKAAEIKN